MDWNKLLSMKRLGRTAGPVDAPPPRTEFTRDYDRIIFSSAFRRLQDKTQVFPLAKSDYVRTRLTHSLEVASVGRSLGMLAAEVIAQKQPEFRSVAQPHDIGTIVATACLAHDIGNPPFGHAGESAIQEWFESSGAIDGLSGAERMDLLMFEGNAQGFRTLCTLQQAPSAAACSSPLLYSARSPSTHGRQRWMRRQGAASAGRSSASCKARHHSSRSSPMN